MDNSFSFKHIALVVSLAFLLLSTIIPGDIFIAIGGILLMAAFACFANHAYRGFQSKIGYTIARYLIAILVLLISGNQVYQAITMPGLAPYSVYSTVAYVALITYLVAFKPSDTTISKKILKTIGYTLVLIGINALQKVRIEFTYDYYYYPYTSVEINWGMVEVFCIIMVIAIVCIVIGGKQMNVKTPDDISIKEGTNLIEGTNKSLNNSGKNRISFKRILINIALSLGLLIYIKYSLYFVQGNLKIFGEIFYLPCFLIIAIYYLFLIWSNTKVTGAKMLLLPLLQKINIFKTYNDSLRDRKDLAKTMLPFLLSMVICPMLSIS